MRTAHDAVLCAWAAALIACAGCSSRAKSSVATDDAGAPIAPPTLRLVVLVVVDQLPSWSFARDVPHLRGGLARLIERGAYYPHAEFPYACTYTAPGHAALCTGASPETTGVLANGWFERSQREMVSAVSDPDSPVFWLVGAPPPGRPVDGKSGHRMLVDGVADVLTAHTGGAGKSIAIGLKDRAAINLLGRKPTLAVWYDADQPAMTTSRWYVDQLPGWLIHQPKISDRFSYVWEPTDRKLLEQLSNGPDDAPGEGRSHGLDTTFPHSLVESGQPAEALRGTPAGTDLVLDTALAAVDAEKLGDDDTPDLLGITLSSHDYAGHDWGQESWERIDLLFALDRSLGRFLDALDHRVGEGRYAVLVTSDHGAVPLVERSQKEGHSAHRVLVADIMATASRAAEKVLGRGTWVKDYAASTLYVTDEFLARPTDKRDRALDAMEREVRRVTGVGYVRRTDRITGKCEDRDGLDALACRSLRPGRSGELVVAPDRYSIMTTEYETGASHGTPSEEDRIVPIILFAPGVAPGRREVPVSMLQVAPTLARLLGIPVPSAAKAMPLE